MKKNALKKNKAFQDLRSNFNDYSLLFIVLFLLAFGLVLLYSTTSYMALLDYEDSGYYLKRQLMFTAAGLVLMGVITIIPYRFWRYLSIPGFLVSIGLILLTMREDPVNGARRWLHFGKVISFQPSEAAKVAIIIFTAVIIEMIGRRRLQTIWGFLLPMVPAVIIAILLWRLTNNLSSALIILAIAFGMIFVACPSYKRFIFLAVMGVGGCIAVVTYIVRMADQSKMGFRSDRVLVWLDPKSYAGNTGYQTLQALYAIGSGGIFGKGLGQSMQKIVVPEAQNDMIFSIICEELGFFGAISIMVLFILLIWRFILVAGNAQDLYGALIVTGVVTHIAVQVFLNIAVVTNTIPNTGVTLPFISYGGSSLFLLLAEIGMVMSVARRTRKAETEDS
ncbi:MAG: putative peptidoglycan glycosyltransferase FtsW [Oscillospiraceae bacterium]|nr:putative peptidoglycan glycosyltransferase FtsW [Oscillospiraceae bacterium]